MKSKYFLTLIFALSLLLTINSHAQTQEEPLSSFKVGDTIYYGYMLEWKRGVIEGVRDGMMLVRYGNGRYDTTWVRPRGSVIIQSVKFHDEMMAARTTAVEFNREASQYLNAVTLLAGAYDPDWIDWSNPNRLPTPDKAQDLAEFRRRMDALDQLCKTKYPNIKNPPPLNSQKRLIDRPKDQCAIAANRAALEKKAWQLNAEVNRNIIFDGYQHDAKENISRGLFNSEFQLMALDFEGWKAIAEVREKAEFARYNAELPPNYLDKLRPLSLEIKTAIDNQVRTNRWSAPKFQDATAQSVVRKRISSADDVLKKSIVLAIGMDDAAWAKGADRQREVGRDNKWVYYKIEKSPNSYKIGRMLIKGPVAGYCQEREFIVRRTLKSATEVEVIDSAGKFVSCP